jgi:hypothetical protein
VTPSLRSGGLRFARFSWAAILCASALSAWSLWGKLQTLLWLDPPWWLQETFRVSRGEFVYRDFGWHFPPFGLLLYGFALRVFGVHFYVVQVVMDLISLAIVFLVYAILGYFLSGWLRLIACLLLIAVCSTTQTYFSLFSMMSYVPSLHTGAAGLLVVLISILHYLERGKLTLPWLFILWAGAFVALLSKVESILAVVGILLVLIVFDPARQTSTDNLPGSHRTRFYATLLAGSFLPALCVYAYFVYVAGLAIVTESLGGFGLAKVACPWWPTGIGIWAAAAALGLAGTFVLAGAMTDRSAWRRLLGPRYGIAVAAMILGFVIYTGYETYRNLPDLTSDAPAMSRLKAVATSVLSTTGVFRSVLWPTLLWWAWSLQSGIRQRGRLPAADLQLLLLLTGPALMSARSLFATVLTPFPEVPAICYPFVILLAPVLLMRALALPSGSLPGQSRIRAARFTAAVMLAYAAARIVGAFPDLLSDKAFAALDTTAGRIKLRDGGLSAAVYRYVTSHTSAADKILEIPYGGGIGFASGRRSPTYTTFFMQLHPPEAIQNLDAERARKTPPAVIVARDLPHFGTYYGVESDVGCEFPRLVWRSHVPGGDPNVIFPIVHFIDSNYHVAERLRGWQILVPNSGLISTPN